VEQEAADLRRNGAAYLRQFPRKTIKNRPQLATQIKAAVTGPHSHITY
jgi:hypothetical protein